MQHLAVVGHPADHRADLMAVVVGDGEILQFVHHLLPQRAGQSRADRRGQPPLENAHHGEQHPRKGQGQHHHQQRRLEIGDGSCAAGSRSDFLSPAGKHVVNHILLELGGNQFRHHSQQGQQAQEHGPARMGGEQLADPAENPPLLHAARAGLLAGGQPQGAAGAARRIEIRQWFFGCGWGPWAGRGLRQHPNGQGDSAGGIAGGLLGLLQSPRNLVEPGGEGVGIAQQIDPVSGRLHLQRASPHAGTGAHLLHAGPGHTPQHATGRRRLGRCLPAIRHREMVGGHAEPFVGRISIQRHIGVDRQQHRPVVEAGGVETLRNGGRRGRLPGSWQTSRRRRMLFPHGG